VTVTLNANFDVTDTRYAPTRYQIALTHLLTSTRAAAVR
jgi:hypothetical protein